MRNRGIRQGVLQVKLLDADDEELLKLNSQLNLNLSLKELKTIKKYFQKLGREPFDIELYSFSQLWSEHCRHKVFRGLILDENGNILVDDMLKSYIAKVTEELNYSWVISFLKDNAGLISFDDEYSIAVKVETHNHPSAIDPFGGAATGVGGVIRDVLGVWASPIALIDVLCFGPLNTPYESIPKGIKHPKYLFRGVVKGIGFYGNNMGIPTVAGAICFDKGYIGNVVVYAGCIGLVPTVKYGFWAKPGDQIVIVGNSTGRDGIHGASFASSILDERSEEVSRPAVQIPDPIVEEKLRRAVIKIRDEDLASGITDLGGGGLAVAVVELADRIGGGAKIFLDKVHVRESNLLPWEIWISESQERMLFSVPKSKINRFLETVYSENLEASVIGEFTRDRWIRVYYFNNLICEVETDFLLHPPKIVRKAKWSKPILVESEFEEPEDYGALILKLLSSDDICSREPVIRTYDHEVQGNTVIKPLHGFFAGPSDAAVIKPLNNSWKGLVISVGLKPWYSRLDPYWMAASSIDEALRNNICVGGRRIAILDNFTWGNPEKPDRLGSLVRAVKACYDFAKGFEVPFISGKDSLYNESPLGPILETLLITAVGIIPDIRMAVTIDLKASKNPLYLTGLTLPELGGSRYMQIIEHGGGSVPKVDLKISKSSMNLIRESIDKGYVNAVHDLSDGGLGISISEMVLSSQYGAEIWLDKVVSRNINRDDFLLFSESNGRFLVEVKRNFEDNFISIAEKLGAVFSKIGYTLSNNCLLIHGLKGSLIVDLSGSDLRNAWKSGLRA
ncbi:MAG TPA: phosphoribosylformylglycinamidine synthase subunit PurL [Candidatus Bathyarchaeota archaeon]|nr:phosphoribosylformylglycinamidine synthase subunit PurL [Candidatus Bathyarchaeota archaeon]